MPHFACFEVEAWFTRESGRGGTVRGQRDCYGISIATMESCTSGAVISTITSVEGVSYLTEGG